MNSTNFQASFLFLRCILLSLFLLNATACQFDEGPIISFIQAKYRVTGNYELDKFYVDDIDTTNYYKSLPCYSKFSFGISSSRDEGYFHPYPYQTIFDSTCAYNFSGRWDLFDGNQYMRISDVIGVPVLGLWGSPGTHDWTLIKLTNDEMYLGGKRFNTTYRLEFKKL